MKKFTIILLCICLLCSFAMGCSPQDPTGETKVSEPETFSQTEHVLIKDGNSDYKIVIPVEPTDTEKFAASELQLFMSKATGCTLPIISDLQVENAKSGKYLSIGKTTLLAQEKSITLDYDVMKEGGPSITTVDDDVYMAGAANTGTLNSVYKFMEYQIGFKAYAVDCVKYDFYPTLKLMDFNYRFIPDVEIYTTAAKEVMGSSMTHITNAARMYMYGWALEESITVEGKEYSAFCHTMGNIISQSRYGSLHPEWFNGGQLCLTNPELIEEFTKNFINLYALAYDSPCVMFGHNDNNGYCTCEKCLADYAKYGGTGGVFVRFMNEVADRTEKYFADIGLEKEILIVGLAYAGFENAPAVENKDGTFSPAHESVVCDFEGPIKVGIDFSPLHVCQAHALDDPNCEKNVAYLKSLKGWASVSEYMTWYTYTCNYQAPECYHNDYYALDGLVKVLKQTHVTWVYDAGKFRQPLNPLRLYVRRQMLWDSTQNVDDLIDEFMTEYYGVGAKHVKEYFVALNHQSEAANILRGKVCTTTFEETVRADRYPLEVLRNYATILESALAEIEKSIMTDADKELYYERVQREWVLVKVLEYKLFASVVEYETLLELEEIVEYAKERYGITKI